MKEKLLKYLEMEKLDQCFNMIENPRFFDFFFDQELEKEEKALIAFLKRHIKENGCNRLFKLKEKQIKTALSLCDQYSRKIQYDDYDNMAFSDGYYTALNGLINLFKNGG